MNKKNFNIYIMIILCILVVFVWVYKNREPLKSSSDTLDNETVANNIDNFKLENHDLVYRNDNNMKNIIGNLKQNISKNILSYEITWLSYFSTSQINDRTNMSIFNLNDNDIIKEKNEVEEDLNVYDPSLKKSLNKNNPEVYIYHTHTTESYSNVSENSEDSIEKKYNVAGLGELLCKYLEDDYGIATKHDETVHNEVYIGSYRDARETLEKELSTYSGYKLIIDMHRDSPVNKDAVTATINGESIAKLMFVLDLSHDGVNETKKVMDDILQVSNKLFPELWRSKPILTYDEGIDYFNQDLTKNNILIEVGSNVNSFEEAQGSMKYLSRVIAEYINRY